VTEGHQTAEYSAAEEAMVQAIPDAIERTRVLGQWVRSIEAAKTTSIYGPRPTPSKKFNAC
jgi:hypothetical protein